MNTSKSPRQNEFILSTKLTDQFFRQKINGQLFCD